MGVRFRAPAKMWVDVRVTPESIKRIPKKQELPACVLLVGITLNHQQLPAFRANSAVCAEAL